MSTVGVVGFGVLGRQIVEMLGVADPVRFDDREPEAHGFAEHCDDLHAGLAFYVGLGYHHLAAREQIVGRLRGLGRSVPALVHPSAYVDPRAYIGDGAVVFPRCTIGAGVRVGDGAILHCNVTLAHDVTVGASAYLAPGVTVSGFVTIGARSFLGTSTAIANGVAVGADARVGIATCVTRDVAAGGSVIGNPMRELAKPLRLV